jgi:hypothetical protein
MSLSYLGLLDTVLLSSVGSIITPCNLCEVLPTVTVQCDSPSKPSPTNTDVMETVGASPFLQCLFPDGEKGITAALALGAHDVYAPLVDVAGGGILEGRLDFLKAVDG